MKAIITQTLKIKKLSIQMDVGTSLKLNYGLFEIKLDAIWEKLRSDLY